MQHFGVIVFLHQTDWSTFCGWDCELWQRPRPINSQGAPSFSHPVVLFCCFPFPLKPGVRVWRSGVSVSGADCNYFAVPKSREMPPPIAAPSLRVRHWSGEWGLRIRRHVVLVVQRFGVGLVIERSLVQFPAGALSSQLGQLSLPSLRGR